MRASRLLMCVGFILSCIALQSSPVQGQGKGPGGPPPPPPPVISDVKLTAPIADANRKVTFDAVWSLAAGHTQVSQTVSAEGTFLAVDHGAAITIVNPQSPPAGTSATVSYSFQAKQFYSYTIKATLLYKNANGIETKMTDTKTISP
ncbi:MAG: hypothetical protein ACRC8S_12785 [Fimbriiglobus sp.]